MMSCRFCERAQCYNEALCVQVAQQEAQRAAFVVERAKQERQQKIVQAEGEAEAAKMISFCMENCKGPFILRGHIVIGTHGQILEI